MKIVQIEFEIDRVNEKEKVKKAKLREQGLMVQ